MTSHASQGKTVDRVFIGQATESFPASSREQFYVSTSRAREQAIVYTDDKQALVAAITRDDERLSATELLQAMPHPVAIARTRNEPNRAPGPEREELVYDR